MRVAFITPFYYPELKFGGPPKKIHAIANGLLGHGVEVEVVTFNHASRGATAKAIVDGVQVQYVSWIGRGLRQCPTTMSVVRDAVRKSQIVHCYGIYNLIVPIAARMARFAQVPFVLEPLGMYPPRARNQLAKQIYNATITKSLLGKAAAAIAASESEMNELKEFVPSADVVWRRNGIDVDEFSDLPSGENLRRKWNIAPADKIMLFVGRISPIKNLEQLILAFGKANLSNTRLVLVGPLPEPVYESKLRGVIVAHRLEEKVLIAGPLYGEEQRAALATANLFVLPSLNESFGNAAAEAVAAGIPVLLTETCGIAPIIHERAGLAVPLGIESLAEGMRVMSDPVNRYQFLVNREEVKRELSWEEPIAQTIALYERIVKKSRK